MADRAESAMETISIEMRSNAALNDIENEDNKRQDEQQTIQKPQTATPSNSIVLTAKKPSDECDEADKPNNNMAGKSEKSFADSNEMEMKQIEMYECLHNEIAECDCCKNANGTNKEHHPTTPITPNENDIFHLTAGNDEVDGDGLSDLRRRQRMEKQRSIDFEREEEELIPQHDLRDILLANYDRKFAAKIGIPDFVPIEVISGQADRRPLEFIPFENIDKNYPK